MTFKVIMPEGKTLLADTSAITSTTYPDLVSAEKAVTELFTTEQETLNSAGAALSQTTDDMSQKVGAYLKEEAIEVGHLLNQKFAPTMDGKGSLFIARRGIVEIKPIA